MILLPKNEGHQGKPAIATAQTCIPLFDRIVLAGVCIGARRKAFDEEFVNRQRHAVIYHKPIS
jgi:hypothetical protein